MERKIKLTEYARTHDAVDVREAAEFSGYSIRQARELLRGRERLSARRRKLLEYVERSRDNLNIGDAMAASGLSRGGVRAFMEKAFPDEWGKRKKTRGGAAHDRLAEYARTHDRLDAREAAKLAGCDPKYARFVFRTEFPDAWGKGLVRGITRNEFNRRRTLGRRERVVEYVRTHKNLNVAECAAFSGYSRQRVRAFFRRLRPDRRKLLFEYAASVRAFKVSAAMAASGYSRTQTIRLLKKFFPLKWLRTKLEDDVACVEPPPEYVEDVRARDCLGVELPKGCWERYYSIYLKKRAGKFSYSARSVFWK